MSTSDRDPGARAGAVPDFDCAVEPRPESGLVLVTVIGEVDLSTSALLTYALTAAVARSAAHPSSLVVDLCGVRFFAASGLGCLQAVDALPQPPARMHLVCPDPWPVRRLVMLLGLGTRWPMHADVAGAVAAVRSIRQASI